MSVQGCAAWSSSLGFAADAIEGSRPSSGAITLKRNFMSSTCRQCKSKLTDVMYRKIFPMKLCVPCSTAYGFWGFILFLMPFNGTFIEREHKRYIIEVFSNFKNKKIKNT